MADKFEKDRQAKGSQLPQAKLTPQDVLEIRAQAASGVKQKTIAAQKGITESNVTLIVQRVRWKHI